MIGLVGQTVPSRTTELYHRGIIFSVLSLGTMIPHAQDQLEREVGRLTTKRPHIVHTASTKCPHNVGTHLMGTPHNIHATLAHNERLTHRWRKQRPNNVHTSNVRIHKFYTEFLRPMLALSKLCNWLFPKATECMILTFIVYSINYEWCHC